MKAILQYSITGAAVAVVLTLGGCASSNIRATQADIHKAVKASTHYDKMLNGPSTNLISKTNTPYLGATPFQVVAQTHALPAIFHQQFVYRTSREESFSQVLAGLGRLTGMHMTLSQDAIQYLEKMHPQISGNAKALPYLTVGTTYLPMNFHGTLQNCLNTIAAHLGIYWRYDRAVHGVTFFYRETRSFTLNLLPGKVNTQSSISATGQSTSSQVSYENSNNDPWQSAISGVKALVAGEGTVTTDEAYGLVTVTATPAVIAKVAKFVKALNSEASKGVMLKVDVYDVRVSNATNYGINWNAIYKTTKQTLSWTNLGAPSVPGIIGDVQTATTLKGGPNSGPWTGSEAIANALQNFTDASYVTGDKFFSLNGQSNPISDVNEQDYVKQITVTTLGNSSTSSGSDNNNTQRSVEPATIQTGYVFNVTPEILTHDKVRVHLSLNFSRLLSLKPVPLGNEGSISLPDVQQKKLIQTFTLRSGQTAVISGFTNSVSGVGTRSIGPKGIWPLGGGQSTDHERVVTVVIVTPYVIGHSE